MVNKTIAHVNNVVVDNLEKALRKYGVTEEWKLDQDELDRQVEVAVMMLIEYLDQQV